MAANVTTSSEVLTLRGGLTVPVDALRLLWTLEARHFDVRLKADGTLLVGPRIQLSSDDVQAIRTHGAALKALVRYTADEQVVA